MSAEHLSPRYGIRNYVRWNIMYRLREAAERTRRHAGSRKRIFGRYRKILETSLLLVAVMTVVLVYHGIIALF